jgi:hypothetical protein
MFQHRRVAIISLGVHDLFFLEVCSWGRVSGVWCCPFFQDGWSSFICVWISRLVFHRSLVLSLWLCFLFCLVLCIFWHFLKNESLHLLGESCLVSRLPMFRYHKVFNSLPRVLKDISNKPDKFKIALRKFLLTLVLYFKWVFLTNSDTFLCISRC